MSNRSNNLAEQRICRLLDENSFMEIGSLVTARNTDFNLADEATPSDGVITGHGLIDGNLVFVYSQDSSVLNGTIGEMHAKKIAAVYDRAMKMGAPVIGLLDCAGVRLQESVDALNALGMIYEKQVMASGVIPQICAVFGNCGGGLTVVPGLCDFAYMEADKAKMFVNAPNAIEGNYVGKCDTSSADFQSTETGVIDMAGSEEEIFAQIRELVCMLPADNTENGYMEDCEDDLNRVCADMAAEIADPALALSDISDDNLFVEVKAEFAKEMVTGFIQVDGSTIGAVANRTALFDENGEKSADFDAVLTVDGAYKAADFINFCDAYDIPVLSLTNVKGYAADVRSEKSIAKAVAKLTYAFANANVPKVNVITGEAYGSAYVTMNSKALGADVTYAWPDASIGMMDANEAAKIMYADDIAKSADVQSVISEKAAEYAALQSGVESAAARGYVDTIINPEDTRKYVAAAFEMLYTKREDRPDKKHGTV